MLDTLIRWRTLSRSAPPEPQRRLGLVASFTADHLVPSLGVGLADAGHGVADITVAGYNQLFQACLQPAAHGLDDVNDVVILWRIEDVFERDLHAWGNGDADATERIIDGAARLGEAAVAMSTAISGTIVASDATIPIGFGLDHDDPDLVTRLVVLQRSANDAFDRAIDGSSVERCRLAALQSAYGTVASFDRRNWLMYRQPFADAFADRVGGAIADVIAARTRVPPKVLVLDCDNTIWGGIAAEDGIGGIQTGDAFPGTAFRSFQRAAQRLRHQGVILALASKNDPEVVVAAFSDADGMVLTDADITARRVSWNPKPHSLAEIASELNVGIDSLVFVDDSEYEIGAVRTQLPDVRCLLVPESIEELPDLLAETGWFRSMRVTEDDRERTVRMQAERARSEASTVMSHDEFLASLGLVVNVFEADTSSIGRATQLINKTNQFNLTTRRRSEADVSNLVDDPASKVVVASVHDNFGEYGIVGVVIGRHDDAFWSIDTALMSCRVLGRGVETALLSAAVEIMRSHRPGRVVGRYVDSGRNHLVSHLLDDHGFEPVAGTDERVLAADTPVTPPEHATVIIS